MKIGARGRLGGVAQIGDPRFPFAALCDEPISSSLAARMRTLCFFQTGRLSHSKQHIVKIADQQTTTKKRGKNAKPKC